MTFDGANLRIILDSPSVTAEQIWSAWVVWLNDDTTNAKWLPAMRQVGGDELGGGLFISPYIFLLNGWRIRPMEANHLLVITGNMFVDGGGQPVVNTLGNFNVSVQYTVPVQAQSMATSGSSGLTTDEHNKLMSLDTLLLRKILINDKEIINNQLIIYDDDATTPLFTWNLKDKNGNATETSVFKSERV